MNARSPYVQNVRDLVRHPGEMRERTLDIAVPEHLGEGMVAVQEGAHLAIDLKLESLHEGVLASGTVVGQADGECARCLAPVSIPVQVEFAELFGYPADEPFDHQLDGDLLDLEPVVRDAVVLALPFQPECVGGCEDLELAPGISLITAETEQEEPADPRWAALQGFTAGSDDNTEKR
ncbi:YceD family protein [Amnibacterium sp.]|uniref:YceD family protein n=1 Tax=Amnibacterium sp. TaxID=1872496 RepID=UPI003F7C078B